MISLLENFVLPVWIIWTLFCIITFVRYWWLTVKFESYLVDKYPLRGEEIYQLRWKGSTFFRVIKSKNFLSAQLPEDIASDEDVLRLTEKTTSYVNTSIKLILASFLLLAIFTLILEETGGN